MATDQRMSYRDELIEFLHNCDTDCLRDLFNTDDDRGAILQRADTMKTSELRKVIHGH